ncbi:alpha/beta fold hydrolase [Mycobacterium sp.]|uniref:alpha/beta hydrolase n=1 Tax=Mycobacterium sp. TaxID=1785 RepID=UPI0012709949|nr:alpha/beta fold hydrolase [Mycobacterium sp.]KAA8967484.1 MAG: alpha/beta hydrolase [Mycobacterium sp.]
MRSSVWQQSGSAELEVIEKGSCSRNHEVPLLFVHGAWHAAWCWDEHFLDFFAREGYRALALSLRGHGNSPAPTSLDVCSIRDFVHDVASVAEALPRRPVVIGHSLGGLVVQKYLEQHESPAAVLLASVPRRGISGAVLRFSRRHPWLTLTKVLAGDTTAALGSVELVREHLFSPQTPESLIVAYMGRLQRESRRAFYLDATLASLPKPRCVTTPLLILGAGCDGIFSASEVRATARAYRTDAEFFPDIGHDMMLEPHWPAVAGRIDRWLGTHGL